jgi:hypothetical protein
MDHPMILKQSSRVATIDPSIIAQWTCTSRIPTLLIDIVKVVCNLTLFTVELSVLHAALTVAIIIVAHQ